jgi:sugar phosphate permease
MIKSNFISRRFITLISLIIAGEAIFFLPFILPRIFRPSLLIVFDISNTELGFYFSVHGFVAAVSYFFGGPLADKFPAKYLMSIALWLTGLGGFIMYLFPKKEIMFMLYVFWGLTTILLFWAALIRATREWGGVNFQGRAFGWLEGGRGATAALLGTIALLVFSGFDSNTANLDTITEERINSFQNVILITSFITVFSGVLTWLFIPVLKDTMPIDRIKFNQLKSILKLPAVWLLAIIIICGYVGYKITDDFSLYANEVLGYNESKSAGIGTFAIWMRAIVAILAGYISIKFKPSGIIRFCFALAILAGIIIASGKIESLAVLVILNLIFVMIGVYGIRAMYFALIQEANIPIYFTGTVVGIVSVLGYTPDIFMSPWMGYLLDNNPGSVGHQHVFIVLSSFAVVGLVASSLFIKFSKRELLSAGSEK